MSQIMNLLKTISLYICLTFLVLEGQAQVPQVDTLPPAAKNFNGNLPLPLHKLHIGVQAGTEFMATSGYGSAFSTFLSPTPTYPVSKQFQISGGIGIVNTSLYGLKSWYSSGEGTSNNGFTGNITQAMLWVSGRYTLTDRITLTGTAYKTVDVLGQTPGNPSVFTYKPEGAYLNVGYKINDFMHIEAGFGYSKGQRGYSYGNPFGSGYGTGFGNFNNDPFFNR
jgi:hypothetical protein